MTAVDKVWVLIEAYGMLIGMMLGLVVVVATVGLSLWRRELRWTGVILGLVGILLVAFSLWLSRDLDLSKRRSVQPRASELFTRLEYASEKLRVTLLYSTCRPNPGTKVTVQDVEGLSERAYNINVLVRALRQSLGSLLPDSASGQNP